MMASLSLSTLPITATTKKPNTCSCSPLFSKPTPRRSKISCNVAADDDHKPSETPKLIPPKTSLDMQNVERRNLLLGLGGIYGAVNLASVQSALAFPVTAPYDIRNCHPVTDVDPKKDHLRSLHCCPTPWPLDKPNVKATDYVIPKFRKLRVRPAAQRATLGYFEKYERAITIMKHLPDNHPHSWTQQAKIHCAYCDGAYIQGNNVDSSYRIMIHGSSLFFPFHRWYLYFHERILGKLIEDETFALPYWNWDNPTGMQIPSVYAATMFNERVDTRDPRNNQLFDHHRNGKHLPPTTMDLNYCEDRNIDPAKLVHENLCTMRRQMIDNARTIESFFGEDPRPPNPKPSLNEPEAFSNSYNQRGAGSIENPVHNAIHRWTGDHHNTPNGEDMGIFYSAAYDPIFYAHHANVDRMWTIWKDFHPRYKERMSRDWLHASYVFYDENEKLVRVYNRHCVDTKKMGYEFENSPIPWIDHCPIPPQNTNKKLYLKAESVRNVKNVKDMKFPVKLGKGVKVLVDRPVKSDEEKKNEEMLFLNGIKYDSSVFLKFDVLVIEFDDESKTTASDSEFAGSFVELPQLHGGKMVKTSRAMYGITRLLENLAAANDKDVLVTLVPRAGANDVTISEIKIELVPIDD